MGKPAKPETSRSHPSLRSLLDDGVVHEGERIQIQINFNCCSGSESSGHFNTSCAIGMLCYLFYYLFIHFILAIISSYEFWLVLLVRISQRFYFFLWGVNCESVFADSVLLSWIQFRMCAILLYCKPLLLGIARENLCVDTIFYIVCLVFLSLSCHLSMSILMNVCMQSVAALHLMALDKFPSGDNKGYLNPESFV